ncbi:MAG: MFS transporter [Armatimonadota bacterium]
MERGLPGVLARVAGPAREMWSPALSSLLFLQVLSGILVAPLFSLFPVYVEGHLHLPASFTGILRALFVLMGGITAFAGAYLVDLLGRKRAFLLGMTGVIAAACMFLTGSPAWMLLLGVYAGLMFGLGSVAGQAYMMDAVSARSLGLATAFYFMSGTAGNAIGNLAAGRLDDVPGYFRLLGWAMVIGQVAVILAAAWSMPEVAKSGPEEKAPSGGGSLRELVRRREVQLLVLLRILPTVYWGVATLVIPLLLFRLTGKRAAATDFTAISLVVSALCQVAMGRLVDHYGPRRPVVLAAVTLALSAVALALLARHVWAITLFGVVGAGAAWSISVSMTTIIRLLSEPETRARLLGLSHGAWSVGFVAGTLAAGWIASRPGREDSALLLAAVCCLVAALSAVGLVARLRGEGPSAPGTA